jgi:hypothetical protein
VRYSLEPEAFLHRYLTLACFFLYIYFFTETRGNVRGRCKDAPVSKLYLTSYLTSYLTYTIDIIHHM